MEVEKPLVTVGVSVYNGSKYIISSLDSINEQSYSNIEIYIVDDSSSDNSYNLCKEWAKRSRLKVEILKNKINQGLTKNCNIILDHANGKYLHLFDQDDIMLADKIEHDVHIFEQLDESVALLYSKMKLMDANGNLIKQEYNERIDFDGVLQPDVLGQLIKKNFIPAPTVMLRTAAIKKTGGYDASILYNDWDMWLRLARDFKIYFTDATNVHYRLHSESMMAARDNQQQMERNDVTIRMIKKHLGFSKKHDAIIFDKLKELFIYSYFLGDKRAKENLRWYLTNRFDTKIWLYHKLASAGIKHHSKLRVSRQ